MVNDPHTDITVLHLLERPDWHRHAACRGRTDLMYPEPGGDMGRPGLALCHGCPVRAECADAGRDEPDGIWGGQTVQLHQQQRRAIRSDAEAGDRDRQPKCGTDAGYKNHYRKGTPACEACRQAHSRANLDRRARRDQQAG